MSKILNVRKKIFERYQQGLKQLELAGVAILPHLPADCTYNYHMFYLLFNTKQQREAVRLALINLNIYALFHYLPLHLSPMGLKFGYKNGDLPTTENLAGRLLRLPFYNDLKSSEQDYVIDSLVKILKDK
jgi:dTDP-4-amino-4,6-dideoxygalactose transaminase